MTSDKHRIINLNLSIHEWKIFTVGRMRSCIPIYGKRITIVTDASAGRKYAEFCAQKIKVMERNVCNSINKNDILKRI